MKIFLIFFSLLLLIGCEDEKVKPSINFSVDVQELPAQESWNAKVLFTDSGRTTAILYAGHLRIFTGARETLLDSSVKVEFYNDEGKISTVLTSKRGRVDDITQNLYAIDDVVAINDSGVTLLTEELMWRNDDRKILSNKFVKIITSTENIEGFGFESNQNLSNYVIYNITYVSRRDTL